MQFCKNHRFGKYPENEKKLIYKIRVLTNSKKSHHIESRKNLKERLKSL